MKKLGLGSIRVVGVRGFRVFCKCGASMECSGTVAGVKTAVRLWAEDHKGEGHEPMDADAWRKQNAERKRIARLNRAKSLRDVQRNEHRIFEMRQMKPLF